MPKRPLVADGAIGPHYLFGMFFAGYCQKIKINILSQELHTNGKSAAAPFPYVSWAFGNKMKYEIPSGRRYYDRHLEQIDGINISDFEVFWEDGYRGRGFLNRESGEIWSENYQWERGERSVITVYETTKRFSENPTPCVVDIRTNLILFHYFNEIIRRRLLDFGYSPKIDDHKRFFLEVNDSNSEGVLLLLNDQNVCFSSDFKMTYAPSYAMHLLQAKCILTKKFKTLGCLPDLGYAIESIYPSCHLSEKGMFQ